MFPTTWNIRVVNILRMRLKKSKLLENLTVAYFYVLKVSPIFLYSTKLYVISKRQRNPQKLFFITENCMAQMI